jgi:hypothetical protein
MVIRAKARTGAVVVPITYLGNVSEVGVFAEYYLSLALQYGHVSGE